METLPVLALLAILFVFGTGGVFIPLTASVFAYARAEKKHRGAWAGLARPGVRVGAGPYRQAEVVSGRLERAPGLVRASAVACFYWSWFCILGWVGVGLAGPNRIALMPLVGVGAAIALGLRWGGACLLRRDARMVARAHPLALVVAAHAVCVAGLAVILGGADWGGPAAVFALVSLGVVALLVFAVRCNESLLEHPRDDGARHPVLPAWLTRLLARRTPALGR